MIRITDLGKKSRFVIYGEAKPADFDPLEDLIGIIKTKRHINVEDILHTHLRASMTRVKRKL